MTALLRIATRGSPLARAMTAEVARLLEAAGAMMVVKDTDALAAAVVQVLTDPALNKQQGLAALAVANANRGALEKLLNAIDRLLA